MLRDLNREKNPQGPVETFLVESAALDMVRLRRARRLEAEYITEALNPPIHAPSPLENLDQFNVRPLVDPGLPATMHYQGVQRLVNTFQRYETAIALRLSRTLHELERVQRMRKGEQVAAPAAVDVTVTTHTSKADEPSEKVVLEGSLSLHPDKQGEPDSGTAAEKDEEAGPGTAARRKLMRELAFWMSACPRRRLFSPVARARHSVSSGRAPATRISELIWRGPIELRNEANKSCVSSKSSMRGVGSTMVMACQNIAYLSIS